MDQELRRLESRFRAGEEDAWEPYVRVLKRVHSLPDRLRVRIVYEGAPSAGKTSNVEYLFKQAPEEGRGALESRAREGDRLLWFSYESDRLAPLALEVEVVTVPGACYYEDLGRMEALVQADAIVFVAGGVDVAVDRRAHELLAANVEALGGQAVPRLYQWSKRDQDGVATPAELREILAVPGDVQAFESIANQGEGVAEAHAAALDAVIQGFRADPVAFVQARGARREVELRGLRPRLSQTLGATASGDIDLRQVLVKCFGEDAVAGLGDEAPAAPRTRGFFARLFGL